MRTVVYTRQSVHREESSSHEMQEAACRSYAKSKGWEVVSVLNEKGVSGKTIAARKEFQAAVAMIKDGQAETLLVWRWSRFARNAKDGLITLETIKDAGGEVACALEQIDKSAMGTFSLQMILAMAELESNVRAEQWAEAQDFRVKAGVHATGRKHFGYFRLDIDGNRIDETSAHKKACKGYEVNPDEEKLLKQMYLKYSPKFGFTRIAQWLNEQNVKTSGGSNWSATTVRDLLDNPFQSGRFIHKKELVDGSHEAIISRSVYDAYMTLRKSRKDHGDRTRKFVLSGLLRCECGLAMGATTNGRGVYYYRCLGKSRGSSDCKMKAVQMGTVQGAVNMWLIRNQETWRQGLPQGDDVELELAEARATIDSAQQRITDTLLTGQAAGLTAADMADAIKALKTAKEAAEARYEEALLRSGNVPTNLISEIVGLMKDMEEGSPELDRMFRKVFKELRLSFDHTMTVIPNNGESSVVDLVRTK